MNQLVGVGIVVLFLVFISYGSILGEKILRYPVSNSVLSIVEKLPKDCKSNGHTGRIHYICDSDIDAIEATNIEKSLLKASESPLLTISMSFLFLFILLKIVYSGYKLLYDGYV